MSGHNELLKEIEEHLEKLASAHTVLSDAIENEKRAGLVQAITKGVGAVTNFARTPVQHTTAGIGEIVHGARHSTTAQKGAVAGVGLLGAAAGGGMNREKQANALIPTTPTPEVTPKPSSERLAAVKAILEKHKVPLLVGGLTVGGLGLGYAANKHNVEKQASEDDNTYNPHYVRNAVLTGGALAAPDAARAYKSTAKGLDHRETFHEHSALSKRYLAEGDLINAAKYADSANKHKALAHEADLYTHNLGGSIGKKLATGAALATAVTGVNHIMHSGTEKQASDDDHSVRNSLLVGTAAGGSQVPSWFKARKKEIVSDADLARANEIHYHNVLNREAARMDFRRHNEAGDMFESIKASDAFKEAGGRAYESQSAIDSHTVLRDIAKAQKLNALKRAGVLGLGTAGIAYGVQNAVSKRGQTKSASLKAILQALETC